MVTKVRRKLEIHLYFQNYLEDYGFCCGTEPARKYKCPVSDCLFTNNRSGYKR